ncbi:MAG: hypothetical protein PHC64_09385 [Candidatus Gastranaerophilales bacterium]|nr:hypothetical protein [Candidatus Gastranaerophilales bacterium]
MPHYHITLKQGRSDTLTAEFGSVNDVKDFFNKVSTARVTNIKEIVYSKDLNINYTQKTYIDDNFKEECRILAEEEKRAKIISLYKIKKDITPQIIEQSLIKNKILLDDKPIQRIINCILTVRA